MALWILLGAVVLVALVFVGLYNSLVSLRNQARESWSGIDVQLKRRFDLVPGLVETVKGYAKQERETLENVVKARNAGMSAGTPAAQAAAADSLGGALKSLFALSEAYPDLKSNQNFGQLQASLGEIEDSLQQARRYYNATVRDFNNKCETFPSVLVANSFGFKPLEFFEAQAGERENVKFSFGN